MKSSGVVLGLKSLAEKIHPPVPLTAKESSRLLDALTSSFRRHLDEAHPRLPQENRKSGKNGDTDLSKPNISAMHSSAASAQRHMASVLTNSLFVKGASRLDYDAANAELQKNPSKDPVELLEEYDEKGFASVRIAELCLEHVLRAYKNLSSENKLKFLESDKPGLRVLHWLLKSNLYDPTSYVDNVKFLKMLVFIIIQEGREEYLWHWMKLDIMTPGPVEGPPAGVLDSYKKRMMFKYRWRGRLLRAIVIAKVGVGDFDAPGPRRIIDVDGVHAGMDALFRAIDIRKSTEDTAGHVTNISHLWWFPTRAAALYLTRMFHRHLVEGSTRYEIDRAKIDVQRYERLVNSVPYFLDASEQIWQDAEALKLEICHPKKPSTHRILPVVDELFGQGKTNTSQGLLDGLDKDKKNKELWANLFIKFLSALQTEGKTDEAAWLHGIFLEHFPDRAQTLEPNLRRLVDNSHPDDEAGATEPAEAHRASFPGFA